MVDEAEYVAEGKTGKRGLLFLSVSEDVVREVF